MPGVTITGVMPPGLPALPAPGPAGLFGPDMPGPPVGAARVLEQAASQTDPTVSATHDRPRRPSAMASSRWRCGTRYGMTEDLCAHESALRTVRPRSAAVGLMSALMRAR